MAHRLAEKFKNRCLPPVDGAAGSLAGLSAPQPAAIMTVAGAAESRMKAALLDETLLWLGPNKWLVVSETRQPGELAEKLAAALEKENIALTDVSHGLFRFRLKGPGARDMLSAGVSLDLHPSAFKPGRSAPCAWRNVYIVLHAVEAECFDVYTFRSYASSLWEWLAASYTSGTGIFQPCRTER